MNNLINIFHIKNEIVILVYTYTEKVLILRFWGILMHLQKSISALIELLSKTEFLIKENDKK